MLQVASIVASDTDPLSLPDPSDEDRTLLTSAFAGSVSCTRCNAKGEPCIDDYILQCRLGDGSEGVVYLARGRRDRKAYAIKAVSKSALPKAQYANIFTSLLAMKALKGHPYIVDVQAAFETTKNFIFVLVSVLLSVSRS